MTANQPTLDRRRHAFRDDLAADTLRDRVKAPRYSVGVAKRLVQASAPLRRQPSATAAVDTEILFGETVTVFDEADGFAWVQASTDGYVGYTPAQGLAAPGPAPTHVVRAPATFVYPEADIKVPPLMHLSLNARLAVRSITNRFAALADGGHVIAHHIAEVGRPVRDFVDIAERFEGTPYLWGGRTRLGLDCSGLVQIALQAAGTFCPRDSDMQRDEVGDLVLLPADEAILDQGLVQRGDLIFWAGHVGVMVDGVMLLHANGHHMSTVVETLADACTRIRRATGAGVTAIKRTRPSSR